MNLEQVKQAIEKTGSIRKAAPLLGVTYNSVQWFLARQGYEIVKTATIKKIEARS